MRKYIEPTIESVNLNICNTLLAGSGGVADGDGVGNAVKGTEDFARDYDFDDEEE